MMNISKSTYCDIWQCPKITWLKRNKADELKIDDSVKARFETGRRVGELARGLFGNYINVTTYSGEAIDYVKTINRTIEEINNGTPVICEASFEKDGLFCAVDILKKENGGYAIYEVKSSTHGEEIYMADIAFQKYVLEKSNINVTGTYLVTLNNQYVLEGDLDITNLFKIENVDDEVKKEMDNIEMNLKVADKVLASNDEPDIDISISCHKPNECPFFNYCTRNIGKPSVFNLYGLQFKKKLELYYEGIINYTDLENCPDVKNEKTIRQIDYYLHDKGTYVNKKGIREFLKELSFPLYFLDFETIQPAIPEFEGTKPYQQIPFQYSLHYYEDENSELKHKEFLAESGEDPRRKIAEQLCKDIPMDVCVTAYNKSFECGRINELAETFPDLADHLLNIKDNIVDLIVPFRSGYYYKKEMGGSFSIKSVLPALFPNDPELDYSNLEGVHKGDEAMTIFPKIQYMPPEKQKETRHNLLKYCELDTYAMVKVWEKLVEAVK